MTYIYNPTIPITTRPGCDWDWDLGMPEHERHFGQHVDWPELPRAVALTRHDTTHHWQGEGVGHTDHGNGLGLGHCPPVVPSPGTLVLLSVALALGVLFMGGRRRRA